MEPKRNSFILVSDLDDTIKVSHSKRKVATILRGLFADSAFTGMSHLYRELLDNSTIPDGKNFFIVSSSPPQIRKRIHKFLKLHEFPKAEIILRDWIKEPSITNYKRSRLRSLISQAEAPVILIGDDTERDPKIFKELLDEFKPKIAAAYIHVVSGNPLPEGLQPFFTAFDLACQELSLGRLTNEQVLKIGEVLLKKDKRSSIIPWFSLKPPSEFIPPFISSLDQAMIDLWERIRKQIN